MPSDTVINLRKQLREKFPAAHRGINSLQESAAPYRIKPSEPVASTDSHPSAMAALSQEREFATRTQPPRSEAPQTSSEPSRSENKGAPLSTCSPAIAQRTTEGHPLETRFPPGAITEISPAHPTCGISLLVSTLLASEEDDAPHAGLPLVLIDARDQFDPDSFSEDDCRKILWLRCAETQQALHSADLLLRDGNLPLVLLDLSTLPSRELQRIPRSSWHRLRQLAESTQTTLLALTPTPFIPGTALRLTLTHRLTLADLLFPRPQLHRSLTSEVTRSTLKALTA